MVQYYQNLSQQPKVLGVKFSIREIEKIFSTKVRNFKLWEMAKLLNFRFPEGRYFFNCDNIVLRRFSKIFLFCFRTALLGGGGLKNTEGGICPTQNLSDTEVLRQSRVSLGWVLSDNFRVGQLPASRKSLFTFLLS